MIRGWRVSRASHIRHLKLGAGLMRATVWFSVAIVPLASDAAIRLDQSATYVAMVRFKSAENSVLSLLTCWFFATFTAMHSSSSGQPASIDEAAEPTS